jgi:hypothetical protein
MRNGGLVKIISESYNGGSFSLQKTLEVLYYWLQKTSSIVVIIIILLLSPFGLLLRSLFIGFALLV